MRTFVALLGSCLAFAACSRTGMAPSDQGTLRLTARITKAVVARGETTT